MDSNICKRGHKGRMVQRNGRPEGQMRCLECAAEQRRAWSARHTSEGRNAQGKPRSLKHHPDIEVRFMRHIEKTMVAGIHHLATGECWLYVDSKADYPSFHDGTRTLSAHRWAYLHWVGTVPDGYHIDHLCKQTRCVRPEHLEAVTPQVNALRSDSPAAKNALKTHCPQGHEYSDDNTYRHGGSRVCKTCVRERDRRYRMRRNVRPDGA